MIITVTLNPAVDKTLYINNFELKQINKVRGTRYDIAGKGINVSKVLKNLGVTSMCTGFIGGVWQKFFTERLESKGINTDFIGIGNNVRVNIKIVDTVNNTQTDIDELGPFIEKNKIDELVSVFNRICSKGDIVVLSGSASPSVPRNIYALFIRIAKEKGAMVILDADDELLKEGIKQKPHIIKPNEEEFKRLVNVNTEKIENIIKASKKLKDTGIERILISLGSRGALYHTNSGIYYSRGLKVPVKSTVGAGDAMVAALVYSIINNYDDVETLRMAAACGAAAVSTLGTEACTYEQVIAYVEKIDVQVLEEGINDN